MDMKFFVGKNILVTGGAGFIGSNLCEKLLLLGSNVINIDSVNDFYDLGIKRDNLKAVESVLKDNCKGNFYRFVEADIRDKEAVQKIFSKGKIDIVIHLAAYAGVRPSINDPQLYMDVNVNGTVVLLECMKKFDIKKFVFASSSSVYGNNKTIPFNEKDTVDFPISPYAASKKAGELICHTYHHLFGFSVACLRFFTVYGPRQRPDLAISKFTSLILNDKEVPLYGDGSTERDYTFIADIIDGVLKAAYWLYEGAGKYDIFNLGESSTISLKTMVDTLEKALGKKAVINYLPLQPGDVMRTNADISKSKSILGYNPEVDFKSGIDKYVEWYKKYHNAVKI